MTGRGPARSTRAAESAVDPPTWQLAKTRPPVLPPGVLVRDRLAARLTTGATHPVTLVSAGPGWGKTMAAASWAASWSAREPVAWLSLDDADGNPESFWSNLVSALIGSGAVRDRSPLRDRHPPGRFRVADVDGLRARLADLSRPVVLIIDDFQVITDDDVLERFGRLITALPPSPLRLILLGRADPVLPLHRLRARGDLTEVRAGDLAFTREETTELFAGTALHLTAEQTGRIMDRTRGWPAGVRAAALSIHPDDADAGVDHFCATGRGVADYLIDEVLRAVSPADREFLLKTSVADMVSGALADHMTGRTDGRLVLERLFDDNVFTVRHGHGWFSYQPLFRHLLTILLPLEHPGAAVDLPLPAARWTAASDNGAQPPRDTPSVARRQLPDHNHDQRARLPGNQVRAVQELISRLSARFPDVPADSVRQIVNASWDEFTDTPIRDFVPVPVERNHPGPVT